MRFQDEPANCSATVTVLADGRECPEYMMKHDEQGNISCYIPLMSDQTITVEIALDMTAEHFEVDLFTDGVIRNFWQSTRNTVNKHRAPKVTFHQGIYRDQRSLYRADMVTGCLPKNPKKSGTLRTNVGSIDVMISKQELDRSCHLHGCIHPDDVSKDWYEQAAVGPNQGPPSPTLQMMYKGGTLMQEADRGGSRVRMRWTRQGEAPWATFRFLYREREPLRAAKILTPARIGFGSRIIGSTTSRGQKRGAPADRSVSPETDLQRVQANTSMLRTEILELQIQTDRAKKIRLAKEKETDELAQRARENWAELEVAKADLERQLEEERTKTAAQEDEQRKLRERYATPASIEEVAA
ncbi:MAG: hypothetical protein Q9220_001614 [cf. Caloplaca sp. 1 TL-2023]